MKDGENTSRYTEAAKRMFYANGLEGKDRPGEGEAYLIWLRGYEFSHHQRHAGRK